MTEPATLTVPVNRRPPLTVVTVRSVVVVLLLALTTMMFGATSASAHAVLVSSSPTDGADLSAAPASMTLTFDEQVLAASAEMTLYSARGTVLARTGSSAGRLTVAGETGPSSDVLTVSLPLLGAGGYALDWQVQSADDLHRTSGSIAFGVGQAVGASTVDRAGPLPGPWSTLMRWVELVMLSLMLGALLLAIVLLRTTMAAADRARWFDAGRRVVSFAAAAAAILAVLVLLDSAGNLGQAGHIVTSTPFGHLWLVHLVGLLGVLVLTRRPAGRVRLAGRAGRVAICIAVLATLAGFAAGSHVGTGGGRPVAAVLLAVHLGAACGWVGAVVLMTTAAIHSRFREQAVAVVKAFATPAALSVVVVVATGLALGARQVASADALITSTYGRILMVKLALVAAAGLVGLTTYRSVRSMGSVCSDRVVRSDRWPGLARRAALEGSALVLVLGAAAALSLSSPPRGPAFAPAVPTAQTQLATQVDGLLLTLDFSPGTIGDNWVRVVIDDTRRPARAPIAAVTVGLTGPAGQSLSVRALQRVGSSNRWQLGNVGLGQGGPWRVTLTVHRSGLADAGWQPNWTVGSGPSSASRRVLSDRPWAGLLDLLALGVCCAAAAVGVFRRRRPPAAGAAAAAGRSTDQEFVRR